MLPLRDHLPTRSWAGVNYLIIAINVAVFGLELSGFIAPVGTRLPGSLVPARLLCPACAREWTLEEPDFRCPSCGAPGVVIAGRELELESIEVEED